MLFRIVAAISLLAAAGRLTYLRFRDETFSAGAQSGSLSRAAYFRWLGRRLGAFLRPSGWNELRAAWAYLCALYPPPMRNWVIVGLSASSAYLAASGLAFAILSPRGLFGIPLLLHVVAGGVFAVSLSANVVIRAREYTSLIDIFTSAERPLGDFVGLFARPLRQALLYWVFVVAGLVLISTALFSMVSFFSLRTQTALIEAHRWSALAAVLSAMAFLDSVLPRK